MAGVISLFIVLLVWRFAIVFGETVFSAAGLPQRAAAFEARSAMVGAGFTTSQSEYVVRDPAARRVASALIVFGYIGPAVVLTLLGVSFVIPTDEDLTSRFVTLILLVASLIVLDRIGVIRLLGTRPARAIASRMIAATGFETWIAVGDHAVATALIPHESERAEPMLHALTKPGVRILAVEPATPGAVTFPEEERHAAPQPGQRVVVFGPQQALDVRRDEPR